MDRCSSPSVGPSQRERPCRPSSDRLPSPLSDVTGHWSVSSRLLAAIDEERLLRLPDISLSRLRISLCQVPRYDCYADFICLQRTLLAVCISFLARMSRSLAARIASEIDRLLAILMTVEKVALQLKQEPIMALLLRQDEGYSVVCQSVVCQLQPGPSRGQTTVKRLSDGDCRCVRRGSPLIGSPTRESPRPT